MRSKSSALALAVVLVLLSSPALAVTEAYYRFDNDTVPPVTVDETGQHDGTLINAPSTSASVGADPVRQNGLANTVSLDLDLVSGQHVSVPHDAALSFGNTPWTIEAFIAPATFPTSPVSDPPFGTAGMWIAQKKASPAPDNVTDHLQEYGFMLAGNRANFDPNDNLGVFYARAAQEADPVAYVTTGRELQFEIADGTLIYIFTSTLSVPAVANQWVHVSAAYDGDKSVRFTMDLDLGDDVVDFVDTVSAPVATVINAYTGTGSVFLGAKKSANGGIAQVLDGGIDEIRVSSGVVPLSGLLAVTAPPPPVPTVGTYGVAALVLLLGVFGLFGTGAMLRREATE